METKARTCSIWLVEDDETYRTVLIDGIGMETDFVAKAFLCCEEALQALDDGIRPPDVILLDITLPGMSGIQGIRHLRRVLPRSRIVMLTHAGNGKTIEEALRRGAFSYVVKSKGLKEVVDAVRDALKGERHLDSRSVTNLMERFIGTPPRANDYGLTDVETRVLSLMTKHHTRERIAKILDRNVGTVIAQQESIYRKLGVSKNTEAVVKAITERLV